jgi:hypothetical protein
MPQVTQNIDNFMTASTLSESRNALNQLGAYTVDYSPLAYPIVFFLSVTTVSGVSSIISTEFPTNAVISILNAIAGLGSTPALEFYQLVPVILEDILYDTDYVVPADFAENGGRAWKKIELAY